MIVKERRALIGMEISKIENGNVTLHVAEDVFATSMILIMPLIY